MKVRFPIVYQATVRTESGNTALRRYIETIEAPVAVLDPERCRSAFKHVGTLGRLLTGTREPVVHLAHDGKLYEPLRTMKFVGAADYIAESVSIADEKLQTSLLDLYRYQVPVSGYEEVKLKGPPRADRTITSDREQAISQITEILDGIVSIDGLVYIKVPEPVLVATSGGVVLSTRKAPTSNEVRHHTFRVNNLAGAMRRAEILDDRATGSHISIPDYELLDTTWLEYRPSPIDLIVGLREFEAAMANLVPQMPVPAIMAFGAFRDGMRARSYHDVDCDRETVERLLEAAVDLVGALPDTMRRKPARVALDLVDCYRHAEMTMDYDDELDQFINDSTLAP